MYIYIYLCVCIYIFKASRMGKALNICMLSCA